MSKPLKQPITKGVHHVGVTVSKLEESVKFFVELLGWKVVGKKEEYPAIFVSDGSVMLTLWAAEPINSHKFDRKKNIGLHHLALEVENESDLELLHNTLIENKIKIEFSPELLGKGPAKHMMCYDPSGIRLEFRWS